MQRSIEKETNKQTERQIDRHTDRQTDKQREAKQKHRFTQSGHQQNEEQYQLVRWSININRQQQKLLEMLQILLNNHRKSDNGRLWPEMFLARAHANKLAK